MIEAMVIKVDGKFYRAIEVEGCSDCDLDGGVCRRGSIDTDGKNVFRCEWSRAVENRRIGFKEVEGKTEGKPSGVQYPVGTKVRCTHSECHCGMGEGDEGIIERVDTIDDGVQTYKVKVPGDYWWQCSDCIEEVVCK